jgi:hypothetical protein
MKRRGYRGVSFEEAEQAVADQRYERMEKRQFAGGIQARSIFGPGLYLISDPELAAQYAFCHAEVDGSGRAAVLRQDVELEQPFVINCRYSEIQLRQDALEWKYAGMALPNVRPDYIHTWIGRVTKDYLLAHSFDGIVYHVDDTVIYYVAYFQEKQIERIYLEFAFTMNGM